MFAPFNIRSCCPKTSRRSSFKTWKQRKTINQIQDCDDGIKMYDLFVLYFTCSAKCLQRCSMNGRFFNIGAKSSDIRYRSLVLFFEEGKQTWSWWRCVAHCFVLFPSSFPGFEIPIVDKTIQGGLNSISIGYGSQYPWRPEDGVKNFTKLQEHR